MWTGERTRTFYSSPICSRMKVQDYEVVRGRGSFELTLWWWVEKLRCLWLTLLTLVMSVKRESEGSTRSPPLAVCLVVTVVGRVSVVVEKVGFSNGSQSYPSVSWTIRFFRNKGKNWFTAVVNRTQFVYRLGYGMIEWSRDTTKELRHEFRNQWYLVYYRRLTVWLRGLWTLMTLRRVEKFSTSLVKESCRH